MRFIPIKVDMMDHCKGLAIWLGTATVAKRIVEGEQISFATLLQVAGAYILLLAACALLLRIGEIGLHVYVAIRRWWRDVRVNDQTIY